MVILFLVCFLAFIDCVDFDFGVCQMLFVEQFVEALNACWFGL